MARRFTKVEKSWLRASLSDTRWVQKIMDENPGDTMVLTASEKMYIATIMNGVSVMIEEMLKDGAQEKG